MKPMYFFFTAILLLLSGSVFPQARQYPDSIRIELPDQGAIVIFQLRVYAKDKNIISIFPDRLADVVAHVKESITEAQSNEAHTVTVVPDKTDGTDKRSHITVARNNAEVTRLHVEDETMLEVLPPGWEVVMRMERAVVQVYAPDLSGLQAVSQIDFQPLITHLATDDQFANPQRMGVFVRLVMRDGEIVTAGKSGHRLPADMIGLHAGAGIGLAADRFYPEFNFVTGLYLANRFQSNRQRIAAGYELKLFSGRSAENEFRSSPASFVTLSYGINFQGKRPRWTALGLGYMIHNRSDIFTGKTMKIFLESDIGSEKLNIVPELYLTDNLRRSIFGIKLHYKF